ncbi:MAG: hypothetical protein HY319_15775 [Armatimonadetes bacterium]|nr:hypothetical protein [Armatimonadota bacterium]
MTLWLLEEVEIDGATVLALAPIGQIYLDGFRLRHPSEGALPPAAASRKPPTFGGGHHQPSGFKDFVDKVWRDSSDVTTCYSQAYDGQPGIRDRRFREYADRSGFGSRFAVVTIAETLTQKTAVVPDLNQRFRAD